MKFEIWDKEKKILFGNDEQEIYCRQNCKNLICCDLEGMALLETGTFILVDECGHYEFMPNDRFEMKLKKDD